MKYLHLTMPLNLAYQNEPILRTSSFPPLLYLELMYISIYNLIRSYKVQRMNSRSHQGCTLELCIEKQKMNLYQNNIKYNQTKLRSAELACRTWKILHLIKMHAMPFHTNLRHAI